MGKGNRMCVGLSKKHICFLERISKDCKFSGGRKLSRTSIIRAFLKVAKGMDVDVTSVKGERQLKERFLAVFR